MALSLSSGLRLGMTQPANFPRADGPHRYYGPRTSLPEASIPDEKPDLPRSGFFVFDDDIRTKQISALAVGSVEIWR